MKIKKFNELFDDPELKSNYEIPYLKGQLGREIPKWDDIQKGRNIFVEKLGYHCPYINDLGYRQIENITSLGFSKDLKFGGNDMAFVYFDIEIRRLGEDRFICQIRARASRKGRELYSRVHESRQVNFKELVEVVDNDGYDIMIEFNNWTLDNLDYMGSRFLSPEDKPKNIRKN